MELQPKIIELLNKRGIITEDEIDEFLSDKPQKTYDPFLLLNMEAGVDLILSAIDSGERICVYGDYDADGITSTALTVEVLSNLTDNLTYYIPSRFDEGYGLNCSALAKIKEEGTDMVITVDCGSVSCEEVEYGKSIGLKMLVTDHHTITDKAADCVVINPKQTQCQYPFKNLAGVGVAFKLMQAVAATAGLEKSVVTRALDLVGIGTIGDIVPLVDENRTLAKYGIRSVNVTGRKGLLHLMDGAGLSKGKITSENISYVLVPHLNASGRMGSARTGAELLMASDDFTAAEDVAKLVEYNADRKAIQEETFELCRSIIEEKHIDDLFYVIYLDQAHEGITGIVAGKVKDAYNRPAVILTPTSDGCVKGTGRSIDGVNIYNLLKESESLFERFGGHAAACGFTMKKENLPQLTVNLNEAMAKLLSENTSLLDKSVKAEMILGPEDVTPELVRQIAKLEPFGCDNPRPSVMIKLIPSAVAKMGSKGQYTRFTGIMEDGREIKCVIFNNAPAYDEILQKSKKLSIIGTLESQTWNGREYLQINVLDAGE